MAEESKKISKSMLIIKSEANTLKGVEQFLRNRDWSLSSTHQMKDAILFLTKNKPSFVLITVDHTNPKIRKLPKIVTSAFPCCVIVYAEKSTTSSFKLLMDSGIEYKINPPVTGPAIERAVNKYIRDQEQAAKYQTHEKNTDANKNNFNFKVEIKGGSGDGSPMNFQKPEGNAVTGEGADANQDNLALNLLAQLNSDDWDSPKSQNSGGEQNNFSGGGSQKAPKNPNGAVINLKKDSAKSASEVASESEIAPEIGTRKNQFKNTGSGSGIDPQTGKPLGDNSIHSPEAKSKSTTNGYFPKDQKGPNGEALDPDLAKEIYVPPARNLEKETQPPVYDPSKPRNDIILSRDTKNEKDSKGHQEKKKGQPDSLVIKKDGIFENDSIFIKGVNQALDDTALKEDGFVQSQLEDNSHLACIIVESVRFSGYLVAALGKDKKIDNQFVDLVRMKLSKFLVDNGEPMDNDANLQIKVKRVDFEGWALEYAQFLRKSVHKGDEVAMAFFPFADAKTSFSKSASENMVSIKTDEMQTNVPLEFNVYIYLPSNKKYILYTPEGGKFLTEQKDRLKRQGVDNLHIQKADVQNLSKFKAQNHLNSLINEFEDVKADPTKAKKKKSA